MKPSKTCRKQDHLFGWMYCNVDLPDASVCWVARNAGIFSFFLQFWEAGSVQFELMVGVFEILAIS